MIQKDYSYIRLQPDQAAILRKNVLTLEMDLLQIMQRIASYKLLRKSENQYRVMLRKAIQEASQEIKSLLSNVPQIQAQKSSITKKPKRIKHEKPVKKTKALEHPTNFKNRINQIKERQQAVVKQKDQKPKSHIEDKLNEIKKRLAQLGVRS